MNTADTSTLFILQSTLLARKYVLEYIKGLSEEQLLTIPPGFNNNIAWNLGHILTTQQLLTYGFAGLELHIPKHYVHMYRKGTSPADWQKEADTAEIKTLLRSVYPIFEADYLAGKFGDFKEYTTSMGFTMSSIAHVLPMNYGHEMQHIGIIQSLKKIVSN